VVGEYEDVVLRRPYEQWNNGFEGTVLVIVSAVGVDVGNICVKLDAVEDVVR